MGNRFILSESERNRIKKIYNLNEGLMSRFFNRTPDVDDASEDQLRSQGYSHKVKDEEHKWSIVFDGTQYGPEQIKYADYNDMGEIPRVDEDGMLIIANPIWKD